MGFENAPKMSRPSETEVSGTRPGVDPARPAARYRGAGAWALGIGIPAFCFWYIAPVVIVIGVIGIVQGARTGDKRDRGFRDRRADPGPARAAAGGDASAHECGRDAVSGAASRRVARSNRARLFWVAVLTRARGRR